MNCKSIRKGHVADAYREGRLPAGEREAYELHYFTCEECFDDLVFRDRVARVLRREGKELFAADTAAEPSRAGPQPATRPAPFLAGWRRPAWVAGVVVAAAIVVAFIVYRALEPGTRPQDLWTPSAHPYVASTLRAATELHEFREGMRFYRAGQYDQAAGWLERAAAVAQDDPEIRFYLGVALLLSDEPRAAVRALRRATDLAPSTTLYRWYLAQAELECGHAERAEAELRRVVAAGTDAAREAAELLRRLERLRGDS